MYENLFLFITYRDHSTKINKRGGSNKGMADGFFCKINRRGPPQFDS